MEKLDYWSLVHFLLQKQNILLDRQQLNVHIVNLIEEL